MPAHLAWQEVISNASLYPTQAALAADLSACVEAGFDPTSTPLDTWRAVARADAPQVIPILREMGLDPLAALPSPAKYVAPVTPLQKALCEDAPHLTKALLDLGASPNDYLHWQDLSYSQPRAIHPLALALLRSPRHKAIQASQLLDYGANPFLDVGNAPGHPSPPGDVSGYGQKASADSQKPLFTMVVRNPLLLRRFLAAAARRHDCPKGWREDRLPKVFDALLDPAPSPMALCQSLRLLIQGGFELPPRHRTRWLVQAFGALPHEEPLFEGKPLFAFLSDTFGPGWRLDASHDNQPSAVHRLAETMSLHSLARVVKDNALSLRQPHGSQKAPLWSSLSFRRTDGSSDKDCQVDIEAWNILLAHGLDPLETSASGATMLEVLVEDATRYALHSIYGAGGQRALQAFLFSSFDFSQPIRGRPAWELVAEKADSLRRTDDKSWIEGWVVLQKALHLGQALPGTGSSHPRPRL